MNTIKNKFITIFLMTTTITTLLHGAKTNETTATHVNNEVSIVHQIVEQAGHVIKTKHAKLRKNAQRKLHRLINAKNLDEKIKKAIADDIAIIEQMNDKNKTEAQKAYDNLLLTVQQMDAQAHVIKVTEQATKLVQNAAPGNIQAVINYASKKVEDATQKAQDIMNRSYFYGKKMITTPVNYLFGEKDSDTKRLFYTTAGMLALRLAANWAYYYYRTHLNPEQRKALDECKSKYELLQNAKGTTEQLNSLLKTEIEGKNDPNTVNTLIKQLKAAWDVVTSTAVNVNQAILEGYIKGIPAEVMNKALPD